MKRMRLLASLLVVLLLVPTVVAEIWVQDNSFDPAIVGRFSTFTRQPDGKYLVAGAMKYVNGEDTGGTPMVVRLMDDGSLDPSFTIITTGTIFDKIDVLADGKILIVGGFLTEGDPDRVRRFLRDGAPDPSFLAINLALPLEKPVIDSAGNIYGLTNGALVRYLPDGQLDGTFQSPVLAGVLKNIAPTADGKIYISTSGLTNTLSRHLHDGSLDPAFAPRTSGAFVLVTALPGGNAIQCELKTGSSELKYHFARILPDGSTDQAFTTSELYHPFASLAVVPEMAGYVLKQLQLEQPQSLASVYVDYSENPALMMMNCRSDGQIVVNFIDQLNFSPNAVSRFNRYLIGTQAPVMLTQPSSSSINAGASTTFSVNASGSPPPAYQWQRRSAQSDMWNDVTNGEQYTGATSSLLTVSGRHVSNNGDQFRCVASNSAGEAVSSIATLTIQMVVSDFNVDGRPDLIWSNSITGERALWLMDGTSYIAASTLGNFPLEWTVAATGDFNADSKPDLVWSNSITGERALWLMDGTNLLEVSTLGIFPLEWTVAATGDFNTDGKPDLVWSNSVTGERALWLMDGTNLLGVSTLGMFPLEWTVAATGDFNADGKPDLVWSNGITGERALWLMDGTMFLGSSTLGIFPPEWTVEGVGDYNGDGLADLIWSNSITGERALWMMNGTQFLSSWSLGIFPLEWTVSN